MPFTIACSKCQKTLAVPDEAVGKKVRCPACKEIVAVAGPAPTPAAEAVTATPAPLSPSKPAGPAPWDEKKKRDDNVDENVAVEAAPAVKKTKNAFDFAGDDEEEEDDERPRRRKRRRRERDDDDDDYDDDDYRRPRYAPHRAGTILMLGIFSLVFCCIPVVSWALGGSAINMANTDLIRMSAGKMDPSGRGSTQAGKVLATIGCAMAVLACLLVLGLRFAGRR